MSESKSIHFCKVITAVVLVLYLSALQITFYVQNIPLILNNIPHFLIAVAEPQ